MPQQAFKILGVPGAGKSTELRNRILAIIASGRYRPADCTICVYGRRPAQEWKDIMGWYTEDDDELGSVHGSIKTIHGVCKEIADIHNVVTEQQKTEFCKSVDMDFKPNAIHSYEVVDVFGLPVLQTNKHLGNLFFDANSFLINNMLDGDQIELYQNYKLIEKQVNVATDWMPAMQHKYQDWKQTKGMADFDDMLLEAYNSGKSPYGKVLVVDECQDLTKLMFKIITENWIPDMEQVYFAGDPRQTIFGFRGASSDFFDQLPGTIVQLQISHRLPDNIWRFAKAIVEQTGQSVPELQTNGKPGTLQTINEQDYYDMIKSRQFVSDTFHLVRTNHQGLKIGIALMNAGIPFSGIMGWDYELKSLYSMFCKIRSQDRENQKFSEAELYALINAYPEGVFKAKTEEIYRYLDTLSEPYSFSAIKHLPRNDIFSEPELWKTICTADPLVEAEPMYCNPGSKRSKLINALNNNAQLFSVDNDVVLSTIHGVKGSERSTIFLHDSTRKDTVFDTRFNHTSTHSKNEACVFYVGATRARKSLYIVKTKSKHHYPFPSTEGL
jgi:superfamily I DNA/RNA helicase